MLILICHKDQVSFRKYVNDDESFADTVDTPKEEAEQHRKRKCLNCAINKGKLLGGKKEWTHEGVNKASDETINKVYAECKEHELNEKGEKTGEALDKRVISLYLTRMSQVVKIRDVEKLEQNI